METKAVLRTAAAKEVFITERAGTVSEIRSLIPNGFGIAEMQDIAYMWKTDMEFRRLMDRIHDFVWVEGSIEFKRSGPKMIDSDGRFISITKSEFDALNTRDKSWHYEGDGRTAIAGRRMYCGDDRGLEVTGGWPSDATLRVACIATEESAPVSGKMSNVLIREAGHRSEEPGVDELLEILRRLKRGPRD